MKNNMKNILSPSNKFMAGLTRLQRSEAKAIGEEIVITMDDIKRIDDRERRELNRKAERHNWYLELAIAACLGAALALGFVVAHGMLTTQWTW